SRLEKTKQSMCSVSCVHVYSLSKSQLPDMVGALYATDYDSIRQNLRQSSKYGGIVCSESTQRSQEDLDSFRSKGTYL
ncbi:DNA polymerase subunit Cdc27, partial [Trinorchestia longiramus]